MNSIPRDQLSTTSTTALNDFIGMNAPKAESGEEMMWRDELGVDTLPETNIQSPWKPLVSVNKALLNSYFWGVYVRGGWLINHIV